MSIEAINEALELLRIAQSGMGPDPGYLDRYDRHHWDRISKCRQELEKLKQQEAAAPVPAAVPDGVVEALQRLIENGAVLGPASEEDALLVARWRKYLLSAAPAAPAVPANAAKDAERYRWLRDRLAIEDIDRLVSEFFGTPDEAESLKTDAAIDAEMQKGGA